MSKLVNVIFGMALASSVSAQELIGHPAPDCALKTLADNHGLSLSQYRGQVVYLDFWASWCGPCAQSFPFMSELARDLRTKGLQVVGVNLDENLEDAHGFLESHPADITLVADMEGQCAQQFGVQAMPSSYLIDRQGVVRHIHMGFRPGEAQEFRALVEALLTGSVGSNR